MSGINPGDAPGHDKPATIRDLLSAQAANLTPSESKIIQLLLADYPVAGLGTASSLARRAGVSDPTVARLVNKLGFEHFSVFQASLLEEVEARLRSPLMMIDAKGADGQGGARGYFTSMAQCLYDMAEAAVDEPYDRAVDLIMSTRGQVIVVGGRFSRHVAGMLAGYLRQLRPGIRMIAPITAESVDELVDLGRRDTLIVFDYRRYQTDVVEFARQASDRGVRILLFSDQWMSPVAEVAEQILVSAVEVDSPYDSLAPAVAQMEALVAHIVTREKETVERRISEMEKSRERNTVTIDIRKAKNK